MSAEEDLVAEGVRIVFRPGLNISGSEETAALSWPCRPRPPPAPTSCYALRDWEKGEMANGWGGGGAAERREGDATHTNHHLISS